MVAHHHDDGTDCNPHGITFATALLLLLLLFCCCSSSLRLLLPLLFDRVQLYCNIHSSWVCSGWWCIHNGKPADLFLHTAETGTDGTPYSGDSAQGGTVNTAPLTGNSYNTTSACMP